MSDANRRKRLRTGFSTGSAAAAAAKAALKVLLGGEKPETVEIDLPGGERLTILVDQASIVNDAGARATVIKDGGDDPDVTHRAAVSAQVSFLNDKHIGVRFRGGPGVGRVTRPGLPVPVGEPAINPVPRQMIEQALRQVWAEQGKDDRDFSVEVEISVQDGEMLAKRTLNPRLGIVGGLSILGTTGLVKPFSHEAYTATIESSLDVARATALKEVVLTTGGKSEKYAMKLRPDMKDTAFIQIADFFGFALKAVADRGFDRCGLVSFFGKAVKQAQDLDYTHAHQAPMDLARLAKWIGQAGGDAGLCGEIEAANTARHALEILRERQALAFVTEVGNRLMSVARQRIGDKAGVWTMILDYDGSVLFEGRDG